MAAIASASDDVCVLFRSAKIPLCKGNFAAGFPVGEVFTIRVLSGDP